MTLTAIRWLSQTQSSTVPDASRFTSRAQAGTFLVVLRDRYPGGQERGRAFLERACAGGCARGCAPLAKLEPTREHELLRRGCFDLAAPSADACQPLADAARRLDADTAFRALDRSCRADNFQ